MTDPTAAAAERMRTVQNMAHQCSPILVINDWYILADAYLAEHQSDDGELITEEWVRSIATRYWEAGKESYWPEYGLRFAEKIGDNPGGFYFWNEGPSSHLQKVTYIKNITTRGQLRLLLRALSQEPQP